MFTFLNLKKQKQMKITNQISKWKKKKEKNPMKCVMCCRVCASLHSFRDLSSNQQNNKHDFPCPFSPS